MAIGIAAEKEIAAQRGRNPKGVQHQGITDFLAVFVHATSSYYREAEKKGDNTKCVAWHKGCDKTMGFFFSFVGIYAFPRRARGSNENRTPCGLMAARFGEGFMEAIGIRQSQPRKYA